MTQIWKHPINKTARWAKTKASSAIRSRTANLWLTPRLNFDLRCFKRQTQFCLTPLVCKEIWFCRESKWLVQGVFFFFITSCHPLHTPILAVSTHFEQPAFLLFSFNKSVSMWWMDVHEGINRSVWHANRLQLTVPLVKPQKLIPLKSDTFHL